MQIDNHIFKNKFSLLRVKFSEEAVLVIHSMNFAAL